MQKTLNVIVCRGPSCSLQDAAALQQWCNELKEAGLDIDLQVSRCTANCSEAPVIQWNGKYMVECTPAKLTERLIEEGLLL